ncbi:MAG: ribosomal RNA small subunit methyltransferase A [Ruminococcaceae bacterium]|nr:ribosomal RNA small subunit methyltransferase A [Oscillospiraceae bacterium]
MAQFDLCNQSEVKRLLEKYDLSPKKGYGQNFLINTNVPYRIAEESYEIACRGGSERHGVLEIGPGVGALTQYLCDTYEKVVAVEIDRGLIPLLSEVFEDADNLTVVNTDFMELDLAAFLEEHFGAIIKDGGTVSVCANLPYYITTPVLMKLLEAFPYNAPVPLAGITVMVQLEVARRLCASAGSADYGAISAAIALRGEAVKLFDVSAGNFLPPPKVASAVVGIIPHGGIREIYGSCPEDDGECEKFARDVSEFIRLAFGQRRKTLLNAVGERYSKAAVTGALESLGIRADIRGEKLSAAQFCEIVGKLKGI